MHLVFDARCLHQHMGGIGRVAMELLPQLEAQQEDCDHLTVLAGPDSPPKLPTKHARVIAVEAGMIDERFEQIQLPTLLDDVEADAYLNPTFTIPAIATRAVSLAVIHDVVFEERPDLVEPRLRSYLQRWARFTAQHADRVITVSDDAKRRICHRYGVEQSRIVRIYNGIESPTSTLEPPRAASILKQLHVEQPFLLYLGSVEPKKGIAELMAALEDPRLDNMYRHIVIAGATTGLSSNVEHAIGTHRRSTSIRRLGYVSEEAKHALLTTAHALVYPSLYEGFGLPPLEAMSRGVPCLVHDGTSLPEIVGDSAIVVDVTNREAFVGGLDRLGTDRAWREHARVGGIQRASLFRWDDAASAYWSLCRVATEQGQRRSA